MQTTYEDQKTRPPIIGSLVDGTPRDIISGAAEEEIAFGRGVSAGTSDNQFKLPSGVGTPIESVSIFKHKEPNADGSVVYNADETVSGLRKGRIWVLAEQAIASKTDDVYVRHTEGATSDLAPGRFRTDDDTGKAMQVTNARWMSTSSAASEPVQLEINLP